MKKNKSAILFLDKIKERNGGPSTYLYNLKKGLRELKIKDIIVISENQSVPFRFEKIWNKLEEKLYNNTISDYEMVLFEIIFILSEIKSKVYKRKKIKEACKYPLVQTHHVADMFYLSILGLYKGIKVLMMHMPLFLS